MYLIILCGKSEGIVMGMEIDKVSSGSNVARELAEMNKISSQIQKTEEEKKKEKVQKQQEKKEPVDAHLDTYRKHAVSNSIEQQIKEQKAKIDELKKNLEGLRETYNDTWDKEDAARIERYKKERELYKKEISENSLKRLFTSWRQKYLANKDNVELEEGYRKSNLNYDTATDERVSAERDYDIAYADAFKAISAHNDADIDYTVGLWSQRDAYWDLARMQRNLMVAKIREHLND